MRVGCLLYFRGHFVPKTGERLKKCFVSIFKVTLVCSNSRDLINEKKKNKIKTIRWNIKLCWHDRAVNVIQWRRVVTAHDRHPTSIDVTLHTVTHTRVHQLSVCHICVFVCVPYTRTHAHTIMKHRRWLPWIHRATGAPNEGHAAWWQSLFLCYTSPRSS